MDTDTSDIVLAANVQEHEKNSGTGIRFEETNQSELNYPTIIAENSFVVIFVVGNITTATLKSSPLPHNLKFQTRNIIFYSTRIIISSTH